MTLTEFKAWFEGYTENITKQPTQKQWARIQERVGEIDGEATTRTVFIDRYRDYWPDYHWNRPYWSNPVYNTTGTFQVSDNMNHCSTTLTTTNDFYDLGKQEAIS